METELQQIAAWARNGTLGQFCTKVSARIGENGYQAELEGDTLTFCRIGKQGGLLGIGGRRTSECVMQITCTDDQMLIPDEFLDELQDATIVPVNARSRH